MWDRPLRSPHSQKKNRPVNPSIILNNNGHTRNVCGHRGSTKARGIPVLCRGSKGRRGGLIRKSCGVDLEPVRLEQRGPWEAALKLFAGGVRGLCPHLRWAHLAFFV